MERWAFLSPYLDEALELPVAERAAWLATCAQHDPALADELSALLETHGTLSAEGFLADAPALPGAASLVGHTLGGYVIVALLGEGGTGRVWHVHAREDPSQQAALKLLDASLVGHVGALRFERERRILARLTHAHIARLIDAGVAPSGQPYLVLEYVDGERIDRYCDRHGLAVEARLRLVLELLDALGYAHSNLIAHRDIKPSNVLVSTAGEVKLLDFGIAKGLEREVAAEATTLTRVGGRALTPEYAAPEQITGAAITAATDVYAVGVLMYVLLTGRHPAGAARESTTALLRAIVEHEPARLSTAFAKNTAHARTRAAQRGASPERLRRALRGDLETIVAKAVKKRPTERYPSAAALADDLRRQLDNLPIAARPDTRAYRLAKFLRRQRLPVTLATAFVLALLAGLLGTLWQARAAARQRDLALAQLARAENIDEFTTYVLRQVPPGDGQARRWARTERLIAKRFVGHDEATVDLLVALGGIYAFHGDDDNARRVFKQAYDASRSVPDPRAQANATCAWASAPGALDPTRARRLVMSVLAATPEEARFDRVVAECWLAISGLALRTGDGAGVTSAAWTALHRLERKPGEYPEARITALQFLAAGLRLRADIAGSERAFAEAFERLRDIGREDTTDAARLLYNWALTTSLVSPLAAVSLSTRALAIMDAEGDEGDDIAMRVHHGTLLARVGRLAEARAMQAQARTRARARDDTLNVGLASLHIATLCRAEHDVPCLRANLRVATATLPASLPARHGLLAVLTRERALLAAAEGHCDAARGLMAEALAQHDAASGSHLAHIETLLQVADFEARDGRLEEAADHAGAALALAERVRGGIPHSAWVGLSQLRLGAIQAARGERADAARLFGLARANMQPTLDTAHPGLVEAKTRLAGHSVPIRPGDLCTGAVVARVPAASSR